MLSMPGKDSDLTRRAMPPTRERVRRPLETAGQGFDKRVAILTAGGVELSNRVPLALSALGRYGGAYQRSGGQAERSHYNASSRIGSHEVRMTPEYLAWIKQAERLFDQKQYNEARSLAERALRVDANCAAAHQVVGLVLSEREHPHQAIPHLTRALNLQCDLVASHNGLGRCYYLLEDFDRALRHFDTALYLQPDHAFAHFNRGMVYLKRGRFREGWLDYEWRWKCGLMPRADIPRPRWDGGALDGRAIMVLTEQGLGDVLQFIRFLPQLKRQGGRVVLACQKALQPLLRNLPCVDEWFPIDEPGAINFDVYAPLLSLAGILGTNGETIPRDVPYIEPDQERVRHWRPRMRDLAGFKVGICWQGSVTFNGDQFRSIPLAEFAPLARLPGLTLVSLQKGPGVEQIETNQGNVPLRVFDDLDRDATFVDSAAILEHLDLVITSDTAIAHLAGALGRPVWLVVSKGCDWRWLTDSADSPWYPTMRLFRQKTFGDWHGAFAEVAQALKAEAARRPGGTNKKRERVRFAGVPERRERKHANPLFAASPSELPDKAPLGQIETRPIAVAAAASQPRDEAELRSIHTDSLARLLKRFRLSLLVTTYQAGKLILVRFKDGGVNTHFRDFRAPMGLAVKDNQRLAIGTATEVCEYANQPAVAAKLQPPGQHDACFLPKRSHVTGDIRGHDIAWAGDELWVVNTRFSCLSTLDGVHSFVPRWRPPFITAFASEDRCHLNGLAVVADQPKYVTCLGRADTAGGWRDNKRDGGLLLEVPSGQIVLEGLSMPHSPRFNGDRLWLLESGQGGIGFVDLRQRRMETIARLPGFTRGLDFFGSLAFVGLSQIRETAVFSNLPILERPQERFCGVWVVDLRDGQTVAFLRFESGVQEIFAVQVLPGLRFPELMSDHSEEQVANSFVLPDDALAETHIG